MKIPSPLNHIKCRIREIKEDITEVRIRDITFNGEDLESYLNKTLGMKCNPKVHAWKRFLRKIPWIMDKVVLKVAGEPKITYPTSQLVYNLGMEYKERTEASTAHLQIGLQNMEDNGLLAPVGWYAKTIAKFIHAVTIIVVAICEGDPYYRLRILDGLLTVARWAENCRRVYGDSWMDELIQEHNNGTLILMKDHINIQNEKKTGKMIDKIYYDKEGMIKTNVVDIKEKVEA